MTTLDERRRALHVADEYEQIGGPCSRDPKRPDDCDCGRCVAESLRRHLRRGLVGVVDGATVVLKGASR